MSRGRPEMDRARTGSPGAAPDGTPDLPSGDEPLGELLFGDLEVLEPEPPRDAFASSTLSGEIFATVSRRASRARRAALVVALAALVVGAGGLAAARWLPSFGAEAASAAHVEASDRLIAEGRLVGDGGALEHLLAAKRLRPGDAAAEARLSRIADVLEALAARALERGDVAVAAVHLGWAAQAAPDRASIRARLDALAQRVPPSGRAVPAPPRTAGARPQRVAPR